MNWKKVTNAVGKADLPQREVLAINKHDLFMVGYLDKNYVNVFCEDGEGSMLNDVVAYLNLSELKQDYKKSTE